jgi:hypothetical protein
LATKKISKRLLFLLPSFEKKKKLKFSFGENSPAAQEVEVQGEEEPQIFIQGRRSGR